MWTYKNSTGLTDVLAHNQVSASSPFVHFSVVLKQLDCKSP